MSDAAPAARRRAAAVAGHTGDHATAEEALHDPEPAVRATGLAALDRLGALTLDALAGALEDPSPLVRRRAAGLSARYPDQALLAVLHDPDAEVIEVAAFAAGEQLQASPEVVARLAELTVSHDDALVREAAVAALGALGDPEGLPAILAATKDKATVRRRAVLALASFEGPEVQAALTRAIGDRDWQVRQAAEDLLR